MSIYCKLYFYICVYTRYSNIIKYAFVHRIKYTKNDIDKHAIICQYSIIVCLFENDFTKNMSV